VREVPLSFLSASLSVFLLFLIVLSLHLCVRFFLIDVVLVEYLVADFLDPRRMVFKAAGRSSVEILGSTNPPPPQPPGIFRPLQRQMCFNSRRLTSSACWLGRDLWNKRAGRSLLRSRAAAPGNRYAKLSVTHDNQRDGRENQHSV